ncbi:splicing factor 3A subunit [Musa troglodytarum]|uniref:Splicing factor 3A subunit n=1 Tax=Musa troglodytarum TaxID=320322 RepID=A0A9E7FFR9_9LILI|nr:splicing factor 3A subunit [Musa troglodytarum]
MSSNLLGVTRSGHEYAERLERLIVRELQREPANDRHRLSQSHRGQHMIDLITSTTDKLIDVYEDKDNARRDGIAALGGQTASGTTNLFSAFYDRLKEIREYHRRHSAARVVDVTEYVELLKQEPHIEFSGEVETEFEQPWADGKVLGWENKGLENGLIQSQEAMIDLDYCSTVEELREVGPEKLKESIVKIPSVNLYNSSKREVIEQTKENVEKKQASTYEEMEADCEERAGKTPCFLAMMGTQKGSQIVIKRIK